MIKRSDDIKISESLYKYCLEENPSSATIDNIMRTWSFLVEYIKKYNAGIGNFDNNSCLWSVVNMVMKITELLYENEKYKELISVNEDILGIEWKLPNGDTDIQMYENARREIADTYVMLGEVEKALELYDIYLEKDGLWGVGWIGYCEILEEFDKNKYVQVVERLKKRIIYEDFRDKNELQEFLNTSL